MAFSRSFVLTLAVLSFSAVGCGSAPNTADVSGEIKFEGQPIPFGMITFMTEHGPAGTATINNGQYKATKVVAGKMRVGIQSMQPPMPVMDPTKIKPDTVVPPPPERLDIPEIYSDPSKSGLTADIDGSSKSINFNLTAK